jgi:hypothetical protein
MTMEQNYPSLPEQGKNLAKFTFDVMKKAMRGEALFVSDKVYQERIAICRECEYFDKQQMRCKHCGCFLQQKARYALDSCPISKWGESDVDWTESQFDELLKKQSESVPQEESKYPLFPRNPKIGEEFKWKDSTWAWNGTMWDFQYK